MTTKPEPTVSELEERARRHMDALLQCDDAAFRQIEGLYRTLVELRKRKRRKPSRIIDKHAI